MSWDAPPVPVGESRWDFPPPEAWSNDDLVAAGADLEPATLVRAYRSGLFPMGIGRTNRQIGWWSPAARGILPLDAIRITRSMRQSARRYTVDINTSFGEVIRACASPTREGVWITRQFIDAYEELHRLGWAHSVEARNAEGHLVGGLYGVRIGGFFAGESMFHLAPDASKVALVHLAGAMVAAGMRLLDTQWVTPHLESLGAVEIPRSDYLALLADALDTGILG